MKTWVFGACEAENSSSHDERFDAVSAGSVGEVGNGNMPKNDGISRQESSQGTLVNGKVTNERRTAWRRAYPKRI